MTHLTAESVEFKVKSSLFSNNDEWMIHNLYLILLSMINNLLSDLLKMYIFYIFLWLYFLITIKLVAEYIFPFLVPTLVHF
jgi:hypothetical protein